ncbi:MAG TPA: hypothetical protein VF698_00045 [Thermoanaerobaculia bacterium]|jgi:hypothetical protein
MIDKSDWDEAYRRALDSGRQRLGAPPANEELLAYARGELSGAEEARVRELLAYYPEFAVLVAQPFSAIEEAPLSDAELDADWASLQRRLPRSAPRRAAALPWTWAVAATLVALLMSGLYVRTNRELARPRAIAFVELRADETPRGIGTVRAMQLDRAEVYGLVLVDVEEGAYRAEIVDLETSEVIWSEAVENQVIEVPRRFFKAGRRYQLVLTGTDQTRRYTFKTPP